MTVCFSCEIVILCGVSLHSPAGLGFPEVKVSENKLLLQFHDRSPVRQNSFTAETVWGWVLSSAWHRALLSSGRRRSSKSCLNINTELVVRC